MQRFASLARAQVVKLTGIWPVLTMQLAMGVAFLCLAVLFAAFTGRYGGVTWLLLWPAWESAQKNEPGTYDPRYPPDMLD